MDMLNRKVLYISIYAIITSRFPELFENVNCLFIFVNIFHIVKIVWFRKKFKYFVFMSIFQYIKKYSKAYENCAVFLM